MREAHPVPVVGPEFHEPLTFAQREVLERAVVKIVLLGEQVGVSVGQMIVLLESGMTVGELLDYLAERGADVA